MKKNIVVFYICIFCFIGCASPPSVTEQRVGKSLDVVELGRGMNIGNALEAPKSEDWGVKIRKQQFDYIKQAGFDTVRIPIRFSDYSHPDTYLLEEKYLKKFDSYIDYGLELGLNVVLDFHHFLEIMTQPEQEKGRLVSIWAQLSERYKDYPNSLLFEILNEPQDKLGGEQWNDIIRDVVSEIRKTNPDRLLIIGGENFNSIYGLDALELPDDENIIVTFHYYEPSEFAFQNDPYHKGYEHLKDIKWTASAEEVSRIRADFQKVKDWAEKNQVKVFLGEFGVVKTVPFEYRGKWTETVISIAEEMGFSWCYWELCSRFGVFDDFYGRWDADMLNILQPKSSSPPQ